jgi:hypothetical protein
VRRAALLLVVTVLAGCGLAGCGGGGGNSSGGGDRLSRSEFAAKADAICSKYNAKTKALGNAKNLADLATVFDRALPLLESAISELRALKPPANEQNTVERWLAQSEVAKHDLGEMRDRAKAKDVKGVQDAFTRASADNKESNRLAAKLGLKVCAKG